MHVILNSSRGVLTVYKMAFVRDLGFYIFEILPTVVIYFSDRKYLNFVVIGQTIAEIWRFFDFQNGSRPLSWVCTHAGTNHEDYFMVFTVVQNLVVG